MYIRVEKFRGLCNSYSKKNEKSFSQLRKQIISNELAILSIRKVVCIDGGLGVTDPDGLFRESLPNVWLVDHLTR